MEQYDTLFICLVGTAFPALIAVINDMERQVRSFFYCRIAYTNIKQQYKCQPDEIAANFFIYIACLPTLTKAATYHIYIPA